MPAIDPDIVANLDPDDGNSHVDAIRELAVAIQELQNQVFLLQSDLSDAESTISDLEKKVAS